MALIALGLGSNLGDRLKNLRAAAERLERALGPLRRSGVFETEPWGLRDQPWFLNACIAAETDLEPLELLALAQGVEREMGRIRTLRWGPRNIDVDILLMGDRAVELPGLRVPHIHLPDREFVLTPLRQILPGWRHPLLGLTVEEMAPPPEALFITEL